MHGGLHSKYTSSVSLLVPFNMDSALGENRMSFMCTCFLLTEFFWLYTHMTSQYLFCMGNTCPLVSMPLLYDLICNVCSPNDIERQVYSLSVYTASYVIDICINSKYDRMIIQEFVHE